MPAKKPKPDSEPQLPAKRAQAWLTPADPEIRAAYLENLAGQKIGAADIPRVKNPSGGGSHFEVHGEATKTIEGVVLRHGLSRILWPERMGGQPLCVAEDATHGRGDPGGECDKCPLSEWGSNQKEGREKAQACSLGHDFYLLRPGEMLPIRVVATSTALADMKQFLLVLASQGQRLRNIAVRFTLKEESKGDNTWSKVQIEKIADLTEDEKKEATQRVNDFLQMIGAIPPTVQAAK